MTNHVAKWKADWPWCSVVFRVVLGAEIGWSRWAPVQVGALEVALSRSLGLDCRPRAGATDQGGLGRPACSGPTIYPRGARPVARAAATADAAVLDETPRQLLHAAPADTRLRPRPRARGTGQPRLRRNRWPAGPAGTGVRALGHWGRACNRELTSRIEVIFEFCVEIIQILYKCNVMSYMLLGFCCTLRISWMRYSLHPILTTNAIHMQSQYVISV